MIQGQVHHALAAMQRARGRAFLSVAHLRGATRVDDLYQSGAARILVPHSTGRLEAVFLNTSGGLTSGDRIDYDIDLAQDALLTAATQTAERAYLAPNGPAELRVAIRLAARANIHWLPQETILFQGADLVRTTRFDLGPEARCLTVECIVLGRRAMGEVVTQARLLDRREIFIQGRPLHVEALTLTAEGLRQQSAVAVLPDAHVFATLAFCGPGAEAAAPAMRAIAAPDGVTAAASGWNGRAVMRVVAGDLWPLKLHLGRVIARLTGQALPRVWQLQDFAQ